jgi:hypothetical protein
LRTFVSAELAHRQQFGISGQKVQYRWKSRKVLVVDEVGILGCKDFLDVNAHLQTFRQSPKPFGGRW